MKALSLHTCTHTTQSVLTSPQSVEQGFQLAHTITARSPPPPFLHPFAKLSTMATLKPFSPLNGGDRFVCGAFGRARLRLGHIDQVLVPGPPPAAAATMQERASSLKGSAVEG